MFSFSRRRAPLLVRDVHDERLQCSSCNGCAHIPTAAGFRYARRVVKSMPPYLMVAAVTFLLAAAVIFLGNVVLVDSSEDINLKNWLKIPSFEAIVGVSGDSSSPAPPTLYDYYTEGGITAGLEALPHGFTLNSRSITLFSGAIHFFRVHPTYWRDRLRKLRACGLNAVETYVPWNLHNPAPGKYDFGNGSTDMSNFLNLVTFIKTAQEEDLLVLVRPGPYICAEWEFGGLPSWLLRDPNMKVRSSYPLYISAVKDYYNQLLPLLVDLQFIHGGPIIAFQLENEYGSFGVVDKEYLSALKTLMVDNGIHGLFYTSDSPLNGDRGTLPGVLMTANFQNDPEKQLNLLKRLQPDKPCMVMEYWTGWFDHWTESHNIHPLSAYADVLERILDFPASVNLYMFHGGTNWGFLNGANVKPSFPTYQPDVTSYDYDAPLSESGDYTAKYAATKRLVEKYNPVITKLPEPPAETKKVKYDTVSLLGALPLHSIISKMDSSNHVQTEQVMPMELLPINGNAGQSFGFVLYRKTNVLVRKRSSLLVKGHIKDLAVVLLDGIRKTDILVNKEQFKGFGYWEKSNATMTIHAPGNAEYTLDILVENWGRNNFGSPVDFHQRKGIVSGPVFLDGNILEDWDIFALQFEKNWLNRLCYDTHDWQPVIQDMQTPTLFRGQIEIEEAHDTFIDMRGWGKGIVFINGFALGRYLHLGPSRTLYLPAPLLHQGINEILIFELYISQSEIVFSDTPILG